MHDLQIVLECSKQHQNPQLLAFVCLDSFVEQEDLLFQSFRVINKIDKSMQGKDWDHSIPLQGTKLLGFSHIYRNSSTLKELALTPTPGITSLKQLCLDLFLHKYANRKFLGKIQVDKVVENGVEVEKRSIQNVLTYREGHDIALRLSTALLRHKLIQEQGDLRLLGIYSRNRQEFYLTDVACLLYGITCVPLYDTLGLANLAYCLQHSNISTCICGASNAKNLLHLQGTANLKNLILCEQLDSELQEQLKKKFTLFNFWQLVQEVKLDDVIDHETFKVAPDQCFTFSYTSGTTGFPKAAMLSQQNFLSFIAGHKISLRNLGRNGEDQVHLSILPMPHVYERIVVMYEILIGSFIVPTSGNILKIKDDLALVKPTQIISVPRLYNRMLQGIVDALGGEENTRKLIQEKSPILNKVREGFGGRVKWMLSGSAPINTKVIELLGKIMGCPFSEAYGQTENTGGAFIQNLDENEYGRIGHVWVKPSLEFKLADIPEMGYTSDDKDSNGNPTPRGEIWLRGHGVILGYYKAEELTKQAITADGWLKTGDVGALSADTRTMKLIDRKKNIFKLSQGEYVSCQKVEFFYMKSKYVAEAFLHGDSLQNYAVVIIVPNRAEIQKLGKSLSLQLSYHQLCQNKLIQKHVLKQLIQHGLEGQLNSFQQAKNIRFEPQAFALRGIVSSTMKLQRFQARKYYKKQIDAMYEEGMIIQHI